MASNRIGRINEEIQRELSGLIRTVKDPRVHGLVSITAVDTTTDLRYAKIHVSVLDAALSLRYTPELIFEKDDSMAQGAHILSLLRDPEVVKPANPANAHINLDSEE